jgi:hypothetical protein
MRFIVSFCAFLGILDIGNAIVNGDLTGIPRRLL